MNWEEKEHRSNTNPNTREKSKSGNIIEQHVNSLYYQRDHRRRREKLTAALYLQLYTHTHTQIYHLYVGASSFIGKTGVTSYEITKLPLTYSLNFTGYEVSRLDRFNAMHLRCATLQCRFRVLFRLDTSECSFGVTLSCC